MDDCKRIIVIGAGIVGVSTAIWLQRDGHKVTLIDRKAPGEGASYGNAGLLASCAVVPVTTPGLLWSAPKMLLSPQQPFFLRWSYLPKLLPWLARYLPHATAEGARKRAQAVMHLIGDSLADHQAISAGTDAARYVVPTDYMYLYKDRAAYQADAFSWQLRQELGFTWDVLEGEALKTAEPCFGAQFTCAARIGNHGRISDPGAYVKALAKHAEGQGAVLRQGEVSDIVIENGQVTGVRAGGETLGCDAVVVATGAWSKMLAGKLGVTPPLETERGYHLELWEPSVMPQTPVMVASGKFVATPMEGRLRLAGVVELGGLDAPPARAPFELLERNIRKAIPGISWKERTEWMGFRPSMSDSLPMIGAVPKVSGAYLGFGHDHVGLTGGPKTGRLLAQMISGRAPNIDMAPYAVDRF